MEIRFKFIGAEKTRRTNALFLFFSFPPEAAHEQERRKVGVWTRRAAQPTSASQSFQAKEALLSPPLHLQTTPPAPSSPHPPAAASDTLHSSLLPLFPSLPHYSDSEQVHK